MASNPLSIHSLPQFDGTNWPIWSAGIKAHLSYLGINNFISKDMMTPTDPTECEKFEEKAKKASSLVMLCTKTSLWHLFGTKERPKECFDILKAKYEKAGAMTTFSYFDRLFNSRFNEGESMQTQLEELDHLRDEAATAGVTIEERYYVLVILCSLPASYSTFFTGILSTADLSSITAGDISACIIDEYTRRTSDPSVAAMKPSGSSSYNKPKKFNGNCNYCSKKGHKEEVCRKKKADKGKDKGPSVSVLSPATIVEVANNTILASFYASSEHKAWMMDSGCTKHMTPN